MKTGKSPTQLPLALYEVLEEEAELLKMEKPAPAGQMNDVWQITADDITDYDELKRRWGALELDFLIGDVAEAPPPATRHIVALWESGLATGRSSVQSVASWFGAGSSSLPPEAQAAAQPADPAAIDLERAETLRKLNRLINAKRALLDYRSFPKTRLCGQFKDLAKIDPNNFVFAGEPAKAPNIARLNRLLVEGLFTDQLKSANDRQFRRVCSERHDSNLSALCLSGGGIRSATFAFGIMQGLQRRGVLKTFDYLSTVSGGGYIGSWLSAWMHNEGNNTEKVYHHLISLEKGTVDPEAKEVQHLRAYSNYLAPKLGLLSADTWTLIATYFRNLLVNWFLFVPALLVFCALPRLYVSVLRSTPALWEMHVLLWGGLLAAAWSIAYNSVALPSVTDWPKYQADKIRLREFSRFEGQPNYILFSLLPLFLAAGMLTTFWMWYHRDFPEKVPFSSILLPWHQNDDQPMWQNYVIIGGAVRAFGGIIGQLYLIIRTKAVIVIPLRVLFSDLVTGMFGGLLLWIASTLTYKHLQPDQDIRSFWICYACFAIPVFLLIFLNTAILLEALRSKKSTDEDREWRVRTGAWMLIALVGWGLSSSCILLGPMLFYAAIKWVAPIGGVSGVFSLVVAHSGKTAATDKTGSNAKNTSGFLNVALAIAGPIFIACLIALLSLLTSYTLYGIDQLALHHQAGPFAKGLLHSFIGETFFTCVSPWEQEGYLAIAQGTSVCLAAKFILLALLITLLSTLINLNRFSLHAVYRNRLVRAYLGASNPRRKPNLFTGFDPNDNIPLGTLRSSSCSAAENAITQGQPATAAPVSPPSTDKKSTQKPLQIINMALNLVGGENLAWQQRKAEAFTASKLHSGSLRLGYRRTSEYTGSAVEGLKLGTAMAVSGAAANSNMGYHSSPVIAFLMTLFNIRLGCWLGNPGLAGCSSYASAAPEIPAYYIAKEAFGLTNDNSRFVFLSDGGHFENLGIYEMVLRRCKLIVVSDAGADPDCSLEDLGNAIRKVRIDLGVKIDFKTFQILSRNNPCNADPTGAEVGKYCAIGLINYNDVDGTAEHPVKNGILIYLKPAICGAETKDVFNYKETHKAFPHESTVDQFFNESQFESYRALGARVIDRIYESGLADTDGFVEWAEAYAK